MFCLFIVTVNCLNDYKLIDCPHPTYIVMSVGPRDVVVTLLLGTVDGLHVVPDGDTRGADRAIAAAVSRVRRFEGPGVLAATADGVYRSVGGREWTRLGPDAAVRSVVATSAGRIYAGTRQAGLYASDDGGETWRELDLPGALAGRGTGSSSTAGVGTLAVAPGDPERVLAGVDPGGVLVTGDGGETWERRPPGTDAVHHLLAVGSDAPFAPSDDGSSSVDWSGPATDRGTDGFPTGRGGSIAATGRGGHVASTGAGVHWTPDAGETWVRIDAPADEFRTADYRAAAVHDGRLYAAARGSEPAAAVFEYDGDRTPRRTVPPGAPAEFVSAFESHMGRLLAGTTDHRDGIRPGEAGRVLVREPDGTWSTLGRTSAGVSSLLGL